MSDFDLDHPARCPVSQALVLQIGFRMQRLWPTSILLAMSGAAHCGQAITPADPAFQFEGQSASDLSAAWWKWAMSAPSKENPVADATGVHCGINQRGRVWFLAGGFGSSRISRRCEIPAGKHVFFPMINMVYWPRAANNGYSCEQAKRNAAVNNESALDLFATIDGVAVTNPKRFRAASDTCFDVFERVPKALGAYYAYPSASDGYWLLLPPLKKGNHTLTFGGKYNKQSESFGEMVQDIEYIITVK